jgi:regulatory protein
MRSSASSSRSEQRREKRPPRPLDAPKLHDLALFYVGRFATTRAKLAAYLARKVRERGWAGDGDNDSVAQIDALVTRLADLGYVDDAGYAVMKSGSLTRRGYGARRVASALHAAGVAEPDQTEARALVDAGRGDAIWRFAQRKRLGPFAASPPADRAARDKAMAAFLRAGHSVDLARQLLALPIGADRAAFDDEA